MSKKNLSILGVLLVIVISAFIYQQCEDGGESIKEQSSIIINRVVIDDSTGGNNDGRLNPGETANLRIELKNNTSGGIPASEARLFTSDSRANLGVDTLTFPPIAAGDSAVSNQFFSLAIVSSAAPGAIPLCLEAISGASYQATMLVQIYVYTFACIDACEFIRGTGDQPDTFKVSLRICNDTGGPLNGVYVNIPAIEVARCGSYLPPPEESFTASSDQVTYGNIDDGMCKEPDVLSPQEFIYTTTFLSSIVGDICISFRGDIYRTESGVPVLTNSFELGCVVNLPSIIVID